MKYGSVFTRIWFFATLRLIPQMQDESCQRIILEVGGAVGGAVKSITKITIVEKCSLQ